MAQGKVLLLVGSESDLPKIEGAKNFLSEMGVDFEIFVSSAHRDPERTIEIARTAKDRGFEVIIAAAGLSAHLPGVLAANTTLPVIGVPLSVGPLNGLDSLFSIVQMPSGIPVATVGIDNVKNAAILACQILSLKYADIEKKVREFREKLKR